MALTLNAEQKSIYHIFSGETQYVIPPYQRAYSWTQTHCKRLFEDIKKAFYSEEQEGYFLGNLVLAKSRENRDRLEVIDGQQRLTTLILLIKVLLSFDKDNKALYNSIWIKDRRTDKEMQRLQTDIFMEQDFNYFREVLAFDFSTDICNSVKEEDNLFKQNICYFYNTLKEFSKHNDIYLFADFLLDRVYLLPIETEDSNADKARKNALQIFETINNRGLNLSTSDIFKARLYSMALNKLEHKEFVEQWKKLTHLSKEINYSIDELFEIYLYMIKEENGWEVKKEDIMEFFIYNKNSSVFSYKEHNEIVNDLLSIVDFIKFFKNVLRDSNKYNELAKWFQLIDQADLNFYFDIKNFFAYIVQNNLKNEKKLIHFCKKKIIHSERMKHYIYLKNTAFEDLKTSLIYEPFILLVYLYLNSKQKVIYPYYNERLNMRNLMDLNLIKFKNEEELEKIMNKVYQFIQEWNENED